MTFDPLAIVEEASISRPGKVGGPVKRKWASLALEVFDDADREYLESYCDRRPVKYGSDCSGIDAPKMGLADVMQAIHESACVKEPSKQRPRIQYGHASESPSGEGDPPRLLLTLNGRPQVLVEDMLQTVKCRAGVLKGRNSYTGDMEPIPDMDIYTFGAVCKDSSCCNTHNPKPIDTSGAADDDRLGQSTRTLRGSLRTLVCKEPPIVLVEHPFKKETILKVRQAILKIKRYNFRAFVTTSKAWGLPMRRRRFFGIAWHKQKCRIRIPVQRWAPILRKMAEKQNESPLKLQDCVLPDSHPAIQMELARVQAMSHPTADEMKGEGWPKNFKQHALVRKRLARLSRQPVPKLSEWLDTHWSDNPWMMARPAREADVLLLHAHALKLQGGDFESSGYVWDPSWSIGFGQKKHEEEQHLMPCQLTGHYPWYQFARRTLHGLEILAGHGVDMEKFKWSSSCDGIDPEDQACAKDLIDKIDGRWATKQQLQPQEPQEPQPQQPLNIPRCATPNCTRFCYGKSPYCCRDCEQYGGTSHCDDCKRPVGRKVRRLGNFARRSKGRKKGKKGRKKKKNKKRQAKAKGKASSAPRRRKGFTGISRDGSDYAVLHTHIVSVAGNTMSPPVAGSFLLLMMAAVDFIDVPPPRLLEIPAENSENVEQDEDEDSVLYEAVGNLNSECPGTKLDRLQPSLSIEDSRPSVFGRVARTGFRRL